MQRTHELKTWPEYFLPIVLGRKTFEVRKNDRDFKYNDILHLKEWDPKTGEYTGQAIKMKITYIMDLGIFRKGTLVAMSIVPHFEKK